MGNNIFFVADTHYQHSNIVRGCSNWEDTSECRNFDSLEEHDQVLVDNINRKVREKDTLYHLGDFSFAGRDNIYRFRKRIQCKNIHLLLGNHDIHIQKNIPLKTNGRDVKAQELFSTVKVYDEIRLAGKDFVLFHYPIYSHHNKKNTERSSIHLFGHVHGSLQVYHPFCLDVGLDSHPEFKPFHLDEILQITHHMYKNWDFDAPISFKEDHHLKNTR